MERGEEPLSGYLKSNSFLIAVQAFLGQTLDKKF